MKEQPPNKQDNTKKSPSYQVICIQTRNDITTIFRLSLSKKCLKVTIKKQKVEYLYQRVENRDEEKAIKSCTNQWRLYQDRDKENYCLLASGADIATSKYIKLLTYGSENHKLLNVAYYKEGWENGSR